MSSRKYFYAALGVTQIKKVRVQVLGRGICSKSTFVNESASSRLGQWWLIFNHYKLAHFCFLSDLYRVELLLYPVRKDSSLASQDSQFFSLLTNWNIKLLLLGDDIHSNSGPEQKTTRTNGTANFTELLTTECKRTQHHQRIFSKSCNLMQMEFAKKQMKYK